MLIFYVRHGDPIYEPDSLTPLGHRQAESVARRLALFGVDEVYASTSTRAMQTAQPLCELLHKELKTLEFMHEDHVEPLRLREEGKKPIWIWTHPYYSQIFARRDVREMGDKWYTHPEFEAFHFEKVILPIQEQMDAFLASHGYEHDSDLGLYRVTERHYEKRIAIFAHENMGKVFMSHLLDIPYPYYTAHFDMKHAGVTVIRLDDGASAPGDTVPREYARARVLTLSNDAHLFRDGLPLVHSSARIRERY